MICGASITPKFWVCAACERAYQLAVPFATWPAWAKALKDETEKERRHNAHWREYTVVSLNDAGIEERIYGALNTDYA